MVTSPTLRNSRTWLPSNMNVHSFMSHQVSPSHRINIVLWTWLWVFENVLLHCQVYSSNMQHKCSFVLKWHYQTHCVKQTLKQMMVPLKPQCVEFESGYGSPWWYYRIVTVADCAAPRDSAPTHPNWNEWVKLTKSQLGFYRMTLFLPEKFMTINWKNP